MFTYNQRKFYTRVSQVLSERAVDFICELNHVLQEGEKIYVDENPEAELVYREYKYWLMYKFLDKSKGFNYYDYNVFSSWSQKKRNAHFDALWNLYQNGWDSVLFFAISYEDFFAENEHWYTKVYQIIKDSIVAHKMRLGARYILQLYGAHGNKEWLLEDERRRINELLLESQQE